MLGAIIFYADLAESALVRGHVALLQPDHLAASEHRELFRAILALWNRNAAATTAAILDELPLAPKHSAARKKLLEELAKEAAVPTLIPQHVAAIMEDWGRRTVALHAADWQKDTRPLPEMLAHVRDELNHVESAAHVDTEAGTVAQRVEPFLTEYARRQTASRIDSPWPAFTAMLGGGFLPGLYVLCGPTGSGKTTLALSLAAHVANAGTPAVYLALEMSAYELMAGLVAQRVLQESQTSLWRTTLLQAGAEKQVSDQDKLIHDALMSLAAHPGPLLDLHECAVADRATIVEAAERKILRAITQHGKPPLVVLDYLGLVESKNPRDETRRVIGAAASRLAGLGSRYRCPVLALSAVSREKDKALAEAFAAGADLSAPEHRGALLGAAKESGDVEYGATMLLVLWKHENGETLTLACPKNRHGSLPAPIQLTADLGTWTISEPPAPTTRELR